MSSYKDFLTDIKQLRENARKKMEQGPITESYSADPKEIIELLNIALATETVCTLRYKNHYYMAKQLGAKDAADEFLEHAGEEQAHADQLADRITQLGGIPNLDPIFISKNSHAEYVACNNIKDMLNENLIAERIAIDTYRQMINYIGNNDPTTRRVLEEVLAVEEEHADDLLELKAEYVD